MNLYLIGIIYLAVMNAVAFAAFGYDKWKAKRGGWRTTEKLLLAFALFGCSIGAWSGMKVFRHKIRKMKFKAAMLLILTVQCLGALAAGRMML